MKKVAIIIISTVLIIGGLAVGGAYLIYNDIFPYCEELAGSIACPEIEDIKSVTITPYNKTEIRVNRADFDELFQYIYDTEPTRIMSVNDSPAVKPYYTIEAKTEQKTYKLMLYEDRDNHYEKNAKWYIEIPYWGIYIVDSGIAGFVQNIIEESTN